MHPPGIETVAAIHASDDSSAAPEGSIKRHGVRRPPASRRIVVIGAGAAGLMAARAGALRTRDNAGPVEVIVLEKNSKTGVKILMSGGTRCNLTHDTDPRSICRNFGHAERFLQTAVGRLPPSHIVRRFDEWGVATKVESTGKIFPVSDSAVDVRDALHRAAVQSGVQIRTRTAVESLRPVATSGGTPGFELTLRVGREEQSESITADAVIVTAGGRSWPKCGTTGDAYAWLTTLGHSIVPTRPALVPIVGGRPWMHNLSGVTLPDVIATVHRGEQTGKKHCIASRRASLLWTHFGFSGPAAMDVSGAVTAMASPADAALRFDLTPDHSPDDWHRRLAGIARNRIANKVSEAADRKLPSKLIAALVAESIGRSSVDNEHQQPSRKTLRLLIECLKALRVPVAGTRGFDKAEVTAGGVSLDEVDRRTMRSARHENLFIAGEVLDVDGPIGGFNFQAAFATGESAGIAAASYIASGSGTNSTNVSIATCR